MTTALVTMLRVAYPKANVRIHDSDSETVTSSYARIMLADTSFCSPSTFCVFPSVAAGARNATSQQRNLVPNAAANNDGTELGSDHAAYIVSTTLYPWVDKLHGIGGVRALQVPYLNGSRMDTWPEGLIIRWLMQTADMFSNGTSEVEVAIENGDITVVDKKLGKVCKKLTDQIEPASQVLERRFLEEQMRRKHKQLAQERQALAREKRAAHRAATAAQRAIMDAAGGEPVDAMAPAPATKSSVQNATAAVKGASRAKRRPPSVKERSIMDAAGGLAGETQKPPGATAKSLEERLATIRRNGKQMQKALVGAQGGLAAAATGTAAPAAETTTPAPPYPAATTGSTVSSREKAIMESAGGG